jgi:hypothetical protein
MTHSLKVDELNFDQIAECDGSDQMSWPSGCGCLSARAVRTLAARPY